MGKLLVIIDVSARVGASVGVVGVDVGMIWCSLIEAVSAWSTVSSLWNTVWSLLSKSSQSRPYEFSRINAFHLYYQQLTR